MHIVLCQSGAKLLMYNAKALIDSASTEGSTTMSTDIGSLIVSTPEIRHGRPCIAGTGITVHRIAIWYKLGHSPEEIARRYGHLTEAQVYGALAYYHANRDEIEAEIAADDANADRIEQECVKEKQSA